MERPCSVDKYSNEHGELDAVLSQAAPDFMIIPYRCDYVRGSVRDQFTTSVPHFSMHTVNYTLETSVVGICQRQTILGYVPAGILQSLGPGSLAGYIQPI